MPKLESKLSILIYKRQNICEHYNVLLYCIIAIIQKHIPLYDNVKKDILLSMPVFRKYCNFFDNHDYNIKSSLTSNSTHILFGFDFCQKDLCYTYVIFLNTFIHTDQLKFFHNCCFTYITLISLQNFSIRNMWNLNSFIFLTWYQCRKRRLHWNINYFKRRWSWT